jgi:hypothetical protein
MTNMGQREYRKISSHPNGTGVVNFSQQYQFETRAREQHESLTESMLGSTLLRQLRIGAPKGIWT